MGDKTRRAQLRQREAQIEARLAVVRAARLLPGVPRGPRHEALRQEERALLKELDEIDRELAQT
jgi:hypothetical protein